MISLIDRWPIGISNTKNNIKFEFFPPSFIRSKQSTSGDIIRFENIKIKIIR
jgi:hypothetical protein